MSAWRNVSLWMDQVDEPLIPRAPLVGAMEADVVIIGAGYTGLWTAYYLKRQAPELRIVIVEAKISGFGASGRNGGWLMGAMLGEDRLLAKLSPAARHESHELLHGIPDEVADVLAREQIDCDYRKGGVLYTAARYPEQETSLREQLRSLHAQGHTDADYRWLAVNELNEQLRIAKPYGAIFTPHCATIQPAKLVRGLARTVERMGVQIFEQSPVTQWYPGIVRSAQGEVRADWVVPAIEGYSVTLPPLGNH
ncbi:MAG: FAD-dependent oxidoreductase, partial [Pseudomonas sp.]